MLDHRHERRRQISQPDQLHLGHAPSAPQGPEPSTDGDLIHSWHLLGVVHQGFSVRQGTRELPGPRPAAKTMGQARPRSPTRGRYYAGAQAMQVIRSMQVMHRASPCYRRPDSNWVTVLNDGTMNRPGTTVGQVAWSRQTWPKRAWDRS